MVALRLVSRGLSDSGRPFEGEWNGDLNGILNADLNGNLNGNYHAAEGPCSIGARFHLERTMIKARHGSLKAIMFRSMTQYFTMREGQAVELSGKSVSIS